MKKINENQKVTLTLGQLKKLVKESTDPAEGFLKGCVAKLKDEGVNPKDWRILDDKFWNEMQEFLKNYGDGTDIKNFAMSVNRKWSEMANSNTDPMFMALGDSIRQALLKSGAVKMNENTKVTLTFGQLKRLVKETKMKQSNDDRFDIRNGVLIRYKSDIYTNEIEIPKGVKKIAEFAITGEVCDCVRVPEGVTEIEGGGISNNDRLRTLVLPRSLTRIGNRAFCWCSRLNYIVLHGKSKEQALQLLRDAAIPRGDPLSGFIKIGLDDDNTYIYTGKELKLVRWDDHTHRYVVVDK